MVFYSIFVFICIYILLYVHFVVVLWEEFGSFSLYYCVNSNINLHVIIDHRSQELEVRSICYKHVPFIPHSRFYCHQLTVSPSETCLWVLSRIHPLLSIHTPLSEH